MKRAKFTAGLLALVLALSLAVPAFGAEADVLTRGRFLTALFACEGDPLTEARQEAFGDVPADGELARAVRWGTDGGVVKGYGDGRFGPEDPVTREQMAVMLYRCAQARGRGFRGMWMFLLDYPDAAEISDWADEAMRWAVMEGILIGTGRGLEPGAAATEARLAVVLDRWQRLTVAWDAEEESRNPAERFAGSYQCDRARAQVECVGADGVRITVDWGGSAWELARWDMEGRLDAETMMVDCTGCVKKVITFGRDGSVALCATEYEDGTGTVVFLEDGTFTWREDQVEREPLCFVPVPVTAAAGILHEEEFGGAYVLLTIDEFNDLGFAYGDSVRIEFSNGFVMEDLPYYKGYYTVTGEPLLASSSSGKNAAARGFMGKIREMWPWWCSPGAPTHPQRPISPWTSSI